MRHKINLVCDKCAGPVWRDVEFDQHIELSCLHCGKLWFVKKSLLNKVVNTKIAQKYRAAGNTVVS